MKFILQHKTTGYYAVIGESVNGGFRHSPNLQDATRFKSLAYAESERRAFDSFSGAWMVVEVAE